LRSSINSSRANSATSDYRGDHVPALDGIRGIAIIVVLIHNAAFILKPSHAMLPKVASIITTTWWTGVQLFFVLSGFLISGILLDALGSRRYFRNFYVRRTLRIFPLYYAFLVVVFVVGGLAGDAVWRATAETNQIWYWTYLSNWTSPFGHGIPGLSHFWSLAVEEQFYLIWPLVIAVLRGKRLIVACLILIIAAPITRYLLHVYGLPAATAYEFTIARWDALAMGALLAALMRASQPGALGRVMNFTGSAALAALAGVVFWRRGFEGDDIAVQVAGQSLFAILSMWVIYACASPTTGTQGFIRSFASSRWLRFFGKYSYAIYVFHFPIHRLATHWLTDAVNGADTNWRLLRLGLYLAFITALSILAAMISWRVLEKPFLDLKERYAPRRGPTPTDVALAAP